MLGRYGVVVMTSASHAEGRQFDHGYRRGGSGKPKIQAVPAETRRSFLTPTISKPVLGGLWCKRPIQGARTEPSASTGPKYRVSRGFLAQTGCGRKVQQAVDARKDFLTPPSGEAEGLPHTPPHPSREEPFCSRAGRDKIASSLQQFGHRMRPHVAP